MFCLTCGRMAFTVQGKCDQCAPDIHHTYEEDRVYWMEQFQAFEREIGQPVLEDWRMFEFWHEQR